MAREFLARLIDFGCDFSLDDQENRRATPGSRPSQKIGFSILQTIVHYGSNIVNLRKGAACVKSKSRVSI
ncbi:hypothetical protein [Burkholderia sp. BCC1993]|uniref:hypothetical protein n=1 Tax=Burkholderia sp. BCC1993 TaxID=2817444 RepID=UPI002AB24C18|nr:hypothetical protein [Burkholderia sp. BCC1993]